MQHGHVRPNLTDLASADQWRPSLPRGSEVVLLDVSNTVFKTDTISLDQKSIPNDQLNLPLIEALKKSGKTSIYLFTKRSLSADNVKQCKLLIGRLLKEGLTVHGVITPSDCTLGMGGVREFIGKIKNNIPQLSIEELMAIKVSGEYQGLIQQIQDRDAKPEPANLGTPFNQANLGQPENIDITSVLSFIELKNAIDYHCQKKGLQHLETLPANVDRAMFEYFLKHKPSNVKKCLVFSGDVGLLISASIAKFKAADPNVHKEFSNYIVNTENDSINFYLKMMEDEKFSLQQYFINVFKNFPAGLPSSDSYKIINNTMASIISLTPINNHRNPRWDSFFGLHITRSYQETLGKIRNNAFERLKKDLEKIAEENVDARKKLLTDAKKLDLFKMHRSNYMLFGAFWRTNTVKKIDALLNVEENRKVAR